MPDVILMYHRVAAPRRDAYGLAVQPARFTDHVEQLQRLGAVVPLEDLLVPSRAARVALTFDDGYRDNATVAAPVLAAAGLPATYFVTTARLGGQRFWWDRLAHALLGPHPLPTGADLALGDSAVWVSLHDDEARHVALRFVHRRLRPLPPSELEEAVDGILRALQVDVADDDGLSMTWQELRELADQPHAQIGAHTRTHLQLAGQRRGLQHEEVVGSVEDLRQRLGRPVTSFAYPFGSPRAVGELAPRLVREAGCRLACSTDSGPVRGGADPFRLPRLNVRDWTGAELVERVRQLVLG